MSLSRQFSKKVIVEKRPGDKIFLQIFLGLTVVIAFAIASSFSSINRDNSFINKDSIDSVYSFVAARFALMAAIICICDIVVIQKMYILLCLSGAKQL